VNKKSSNEPSVNQFMRLVWEQQLKRRVRLFGRPFAKRFAPCYRVVVCPVCLSCL